MKNVHLIATDKPNQALKDAAERLKGKELFKESNDRARKILSEIKSLPIQETLEKAAERLYPLSAIPRKLWLKGAKWQQEQDRNVYLNGYVDGSREQAKLMYSEEDMIEASKYGYNFHKTTQFPQQEFEDSCIRNTQQWLTTLKNK